MRNNNTLKIVKSEPGSKFNKQVCDYNNEIINYHLMRNKIYILCATKQKMMIYNIMKLKKIVEFKLNNVLTFEKIIEILNKYDIVTLRSWFSIDIKLGIPTITFTQETLFNNINDFDQEYLEKVLEKTNNFNNLVPIEFKFSEIMNSQSPSHNRANLNNSKYNASMNNSMASSKKGNNININESCGYNLIKLILSGYEKSKLDKYTKFFEQYFYDTRDYIKVEFLKKLNTTKQDEAEFNSLFIFTTIGNLISIGPYFNDIDKNLLIPPFIKEIIKVVIILLSLA
jgi:hypothetical protein